MVDNVAATHLPKLELPNQDEVSHSIEYKVGMAAGTITNLLLVDAAVSTLGGIEPSLILYPAERTRCRQKRSLCRAVCRHQWRCGQLKRDWYFAEEFPSHCQGYKTEAGEDATEISCILCFSNEALVPS